MYKKRTKEIRNLVSFLFPFRNIRFSHLGNIRNHKLIHVYKNRHTFIIWNNKQACIKNSVGMSDRSPPIVKCKTRKIFPRIAIRDTSSFLLHVLLLTVCTSKLFSLLISSQMIELRTSTECFESTTNHNQTKNANSACRNGIYCYNYSFISTCYIRERTQKYSIIRHILE